MNANFSEPRSLFGGGAVNSSSINLSSSKKKRVMGLGLPFEYSDSKKGGCFDFNLETVQEKVKDEKIQLNISDVKKIGGGEKSVEKFRKSSNTEGVKKVVNGGIQLQTIPLPGLEDKSKEIKLRQKKKSLAEYQNSSHKSR
jgi:hypothetical protein